MRLTPLRVPDAPFDPVAARWLRPMPRSSALAWPETVEYACALEVPRRRLRGARARFWLMLAATVAYAGCAWIAL